MSSPHTHSSGGDAGAGPSRNATPSRSPVSQGLSASLAAHLIKPVAPTTTSSAASASPSTSTAHAHVGNDSPGQVPRTSGSSAFLHNGKAQAIAADASSIADGDLWKSAAARRAEKAWALQSEKTLYLSDARFKKYVIAIDKCLASFESVSEWADFIAFLSRLLKTLQSFPQYNAIPRKLLVAKRLAQCLNPALPSGVHQRALDVYDHIFTIITLEGLRRDIAVWSPGLLPFFPFASMTVKAIVLGIVERYYLPLGLDVRLVIKPLQVALLPGLEEEAGEYFDRTLKIMDKIVAGVGQDCFLQVLWLQMINIKGVRLPALHYLARRLPVLNQPDEGASALTAIVGPDPGLMMRAFAAALEDDTLLVQRAMLDLLVTHLQVDSATFSSFIRADDRVLLVRASLGVVLRRDLSLNRRLYVWLSGPSEEQDVQLKFFESHSLAYTKGALMIDLDVSDEAAGHANMSDRQRSVRILISLLDKWSIGLPLTNAMVIDVFAALRHDMAIQRKSATTSRAGTSDISTTAKMFFEAVDPFAMFRQFFFAIQAEGRAQAAAQISVLALLRFIFSSFRVHDEESRVVHLPTILAALIELSTQCSDQAWKLDAMQLAREILVLIPKRVFANRSRDSAVKTMSFEEHAAHLYEAEASSADTAAKRYVGFQHPDSIAALYDTCSAHLANDATKEVTVEACSILCALFAVVDASSSHEVANVDHTPSDMIDWDAKACQAKMLALLPAAQSFQEVEAYIEVFIASQRCRAFRSKMNPKDSRVVKVMSEELFQFMSQSAAPYHVRAADLFWAVSDLAGGAGLSTALCRRITDGDPEAFEDGFEVFDVLWKYSEEMRLSSPVLREPLLCVLDVLRSRDWEERQIVEAWVRNNTRSFNALLDPLMHWIDGSQYKHTTVTTLVENIEVEHLVFRRKPDIGRTLHRVSILLHLARVGNANFARAMRATMVRIMTAKQDAEHQQAPATYGQVISDAAGLLLNTNLPDDNEETSDLHAMSAELLHVVIAKMNVEQRVIVSVQKALLERLLLDINAERFKAQSKLLQALHGMMSLQASLTSSKKVAPPTLLLPTLKAGLTQPGNKRVLQHWSEFVHAMAPIYKTSLPDLLMPLNQGLCALVRTSIEDLQDAYDAGTSDVSSSTTETEILALMAMSERILLQSLEVQGDVKPLEPAGLGFSEKVDPFGFMGALSNVFATDTGVLNEGQPSSSAVWKSLHHTVRTLHLVWLVATPTEEISKLSSGRLPDSRVDTLAYVKSKIQARCRRYFEKLYRNHSGEVVEALIACWQTSSASGDLKGSQGAFEVLSQLAPSAQIVVTFLCDVISTRMAPVPAVEKTSRNSAIPVVSSSVLFAFLEAYLTRLDATATVQVWPVVIMLIRDILSSSSQHKAQIYPALRCLTVAAEHVNESNKGDDRRLRRELIDNYVRLCDLAVLIAGRSFESTSWIGRRTQTADVPDVGEKAAARIDPMSASFIELSTGSSQLIEAIEIYLAKSALPALRRFAAELDKIMGLAANIVYYVSANGLRQKTKGVPDVSPANVALILELTRHHGTIKYWRTPVIDLFNDARFFQQTLDAGKGWTPVVHALMSSDKERFIETVGRVSTPSANIFTNREAETALRAVQVRRLSYALYSAPKDYWLPQLPLIQEKLVDLLRNSTTDPVVCEAYLCLRMLVVRFSSQHLSFLWPLVVTEMVRVFEDCLDELPADESDKLMLVLAACKLLDLLITLEVDEFQIHQWLFITDTSDIVYPPNDWTSESLLDRLALAVEEKRGSQHRFAGARNRPSSVRSGREAHAHSESPRLGFDATHDSMKTDQSSSHDVEALHKRRPLLSAQVGMHIHAMEDLQPFFANASLHCYESTYRAGHAVDEDAVERSLLADMFPRASAGADAHSITHEKPG